MTRSHYNYICIDINIEREILDTFKMNRTPMSESYLNSQAGKEQNRQVAQPASQHQPQSGGSQQGEDFQPISGSSSNPRASSSATNNPNQNPNQNQSQQQRPPIPQLMCATELTNLLLEFAFSVFVNKPDDIVEYAASYFNQLRGQRPQGQAQLTEWLGAGKRASNDSQKSYSSTSSNDHQANIINTNANNNINTTGQTNECLEDDFEYEPLGRMVSNSNVQPKLSFNRRKSVFAEHYDPANDLEEDENNRVIHGKTDEQRQRLAKAIKSIFIFRSVDPQDVTNILDAMFEVKVSAGDVVIRQGDDGDNFYVVERGKFQIYVTLDDGTRQVRGEYEDNGSFGELALMYNQPRAATVIALSDGSLWAMDRNTFRRIVLKSAFKKRKEYEALFEKVSVLQCLNVSNLELP